RVYAVWREKQLPFLNSQAFQVQPCVGADAGKCGDSVVQVSQNCVSNYASQPAVHPSSVGKLAAHNNGNPQFSRRHEHLPFKCMHVAREKDRIEMAVANYSVCSRQTKRESGADEWHLRQEPMAISLQ